MKDEIRIGSVEAAGLVARALEASGVSRTNAACVASALVAAEIDGQKGHGFSRVIAYAAQARAGKVDGKAEPKCTNVAPAVLRIDAGNGFAFPAIDLAIDRLAPLARQFGIAAAAITRSHHCGQLGAHVERLAERGILAIMVANAPKAMAPWGGKEPLFGTNPIAFAAPRDGTAPLVIDLSLSKVARGKIMAAGQRGEAIPEGWALDKNGQPTTDPKAALDGTMVPAGGAKGAALALLVEVLAATLTGANYSYEASSFFDDQGPPPGVGHFIIAIDAGQVTRNRFAGRLEALLAAVEAEGGTRLPGMSRLKARAMVSENGIAMPAPLHAAISELAGNKPAAH